MTTAQVKKNLNAAFVFELRPGVWSVILKTGQRVLSRSPFKGSYGNVN